METAGPNAHQFEGVKTPSSHIQFSSLPVSSHQSVSMHPWYPSQVETSPTTYQSFPPHSLNQIQPPLVHKRGREYGGHQIDMQQQYPPPHESYTWGPPPSDASPPPPSEYTYPPYQHQQPYQHHNHRSQIGQSFPPPQSSNHIQPFLHSHSNSFFHPQQQQQPYQQRLYYQPQYRTAITLAQVQQPYSIVTNSNNQQTYRICKDLRPQYQPCAQQLPQSDIYDRYCSNSSSFLQTPIPPKPIQKLLSNDMILFLDNVDRSREWKCSDGGVPPLYDFEVYYYPIYKEERCSRTLLSCL